jgi:16S rRNA processing protein RimM
MKTHGAKGAVKASIDAPYLDVLLDKGIVFLSVDGRPAPFFIEYLREVGDYLLKLEGIDSPDQAKKLTNTPLLLRQTDLPADLVPDETEDLSTLAGFMLQDAEGRDIGRIESVESFPQQEMAIVEYEGRSVMIPLHQRLVVRLDLPARIIRMRLPDGLLDL